MLKVANVGSRIAYAVMYQIGGLRFFSLTPLPREAD